MGLKAFTHCSWEAAGLLDLKLTSVARESQGRDEATVQLLALLLCTLAGLTAVLSVLRQSISRHG